MDSDFIKTGEVTEASMIELGYSLVSSRFVKYPDCNATENLFGGNLLAWIDESSAIFASKHMKTNQIVTVNFGSLRFQHKTELKRILSIYLKIVKKGRTSLTVHAVAARSIQDDAGAISEAQLIVGETEVTFVSIGKNGSPIQWNFEDEGPEHKI